MKLAACAAGFFLVADSAMAQGSSYAQLPGWEVDDHGAAWAVFHKSCSAVLGKTPAARPAKMQDAALRHVCAEAVRRPEELDSHQAKIFFETHFEPVRLTKSADGLMTGYYEPEFAGSRQRTARFSVSVLRRPKDLVSNVAPPGQPALTAARRNADGSLSPFPDRLAIENGALDKDRLELVWMESVFERFTMQVQGSARLKLTDGSVMRLGYDGKNGQPYTSIGKVMIERGLLKKGAVSMQAIGAVFAQNPQLANEVMLHNKSYVFFRELKNIDAARGPLGAQGLALTPLRSIAVDRTLYSYGTPFYISGALPRPQGAAPFHQLVVAQDTGTAIVGPARLDLFTGWGKEAAALAGVMQEHVDVFVLKARP